VLRYAVTLQVCTHPNIFIAGVTAGVAMSVTAGNSILSLVTELTWQSLIHLVPQFVIAFEAAYETMSDVTSTTNYVSYFFIDALTPYVSL